MKKKKIVCGLLKPTFSSDVSGMAYEIKEVDDCEYSEEWFADGCKDPIKEYVENDITNVGSFDGYAWDLNSGHSIWYGKFSVGNIAHILYKDGKPCEMYWVSE